MIKKLILPAMLMLSSLHADYNQKVKLPTISFPMVADENFRAMQRNCQWCHSYGYIINQGKQSRKFWHKSVVKMREVYKAPITEEDEKLVTDYLFKYYGNSKLK
ncbi:MAG: sulfite:cytochrome C oxidoreductase subunit B [Epsilonproteobacteria bacterium]|nr:MAG: sulfite:cytochrome C oxidoreductase subunit B [Campylobacterota bacterium]